MSHLSLPIGVMALSGAGGLVKAVFAPWLGDSIIGIYDPVADSYSDGPNPSKEYYGAVLDPNGRVLFMPDESDGTGNIGVYDPSDGTFSTITSNIYRYRKGGANDEANNRVVMAPFDGFDTGVGLLDLSTDTFSQGPAVPDANSIFCGNVQVGDGRFIFVPQAHTNVGIFDPSDDSYTDGPAHGEGSGLEFEEGVLLDDGRVVFIPNEAGNFGIFDPSDDSYTSGPAHGAGNDQVFLGGVKVPDGRVICAPGRHSNVGIFDPSDDSYADGPAHGYTDLSNLPAFNGAVHVGDGIVVFVPMEAPEVGIFNANDDSFTVGSAHGHTNNTFAGGARAA